MSDLVVVDASVLLAIALPDPQANKDYASALLFAIDKGDVTPVLTQLCCQEVAAKLVRKVRGVVITVDPQTLLIFCGAVLVLLVSPAPNMAFLLSHGLSHGARGGLVERPASLPPTLCLPL